MLLHEAIDQIDLGAHPYFLIVDAAGMLVGILSPEEIAERIGSWNDAERKRWADMPLESLLRTRIEHGHYLDHENGSVWGPGATLPCTMIAENGKPLAIMTGGDMLISWKAAESTLRAALIDSVTQLPNRTVFHQRLAEELVRAQRLKHSVGVILVDVDHFKQTNDEYGHPIGDSVLQSVARCLQDTMRSYDHVARFGGDEFAIVVCGCRPNEIDLPLLRLQQAIRALRLKSSPAFARISVSIGAAMAHDPQAIDHGDSLIDAADQCLYRAKASGRDCSFRREALAGPIDATPIIVIKERQTSAPANMMAAVGPSS